MSVVYLGDDTLRLENIWSVADGPELDTVVLGVADVIDNGDGTVTLVLPGVGGGGPPDPELPEEPQEPEDPTAEYPVFPTDTLSDLYDRLPEVYRVLDAAAEPPYPLRRFMASVVDQVGHVFGVIDAVDFEPADSREDATQSASALADPDRAPVAWLPWIGQLIGVRVNTALPDAAQRDQIRGAVSGFRGGTRGAIAAAAKSALIGSQFVQIFDHSANAPGDGGEFDILIVTRSGETPSTEAVLQAVVDKGAKPAGVVLHHRSYATDWATFQTTYPTWASINGKTWARLQEGPG